MTHQEICNGKLIILSNDGTLDKLSKKLYENAHVILLDMSNGTYVTLKNRQGDNGETVTKKEITKFMLRL